MKKVLLFLLIGAGVLYFIGAFSDDESEDYVASENYEVISDNELKEAVYRNAVNYVNTNTSYVLGKMGSGGKFDCSGLVTKCYADALKGTDYKLPYKYSSSGHATADDIMTVFSSNTDEPERGDLVFINFDRGWNFDAGHVGIFVGYEGNNIKFIDASGYEGYDKVVDFRTINRYDDAILGYGEMKIAHK